MYCIITIAWDILCNKNISRSLARYVVHSCVYEPILRCVLVPIIIYSCSPKWIVPNCGVLKIAVY